MEKKFEKIKRRIIQDQDNQKFTNQNLEPLFSGSVHSEILIIGQAPGIRAQESGIPWDDKSGDTLRDWLGLSKEDFYDELKVAIVPMDFYYPGKGKSGDLPPRKDFAKKWHPEILSLFEEDPFTILIGGYAQKFYLKDSSKKNLTETVKVYSEFVPTGYLPLPHPSPRNNIWMKKNPWFVQNVIPELKNIIQTKINI